MSELFPPQETDIRALIIRPRHRHVFATIILGYRIGFFSIDPKLGGATRIFVGDDREHPLPFGALPAGYVFSIIFGGVLVFCAFNTLASKIASFVSFFPCDSCTTGQRG